VDLRNHVLVRVHLVNTIEQFMLDGDATTVETCYS